VSGSPDVRLHLSTCRLLFVSQSGSWCPALRMSLFTLFPLINYLSPGMPSAAPVFGCLSLLVSRHLTPSLASVVRVSGCFSSLVSLHLSPALSRGIRLVFRCLFFAFTSLSSGVSFHVSPNLLVSQLICLQSRVCLCGVWLYRLVICLSPSVSFICLGSYALVAVSCSSFIMISFVLRDCL
jgi:hypothetical protein